MAWSGSPVSARRGPAIVPQSAPSPAQRETVGEIYTLYVLPDFQERGIGRLLLTAAFAALIESSCSCGFLWALRDNHARYFYERVGGKMIAERQERMWGFMTDQVCYGWSDLAQATTARTQPRGDRGGGDGMHIGARRRSDAHHVRH